MDGILTFEERKWLIFTCTQISWLKLKLDHPQTDIPYIFSDVAFSCPYCGQPYRWSPSDMCQSTYQIPIEYACGSVIIYSKDPNTILYTMHADKINISEECRLRSEIDRDLNKDEEMI